MKFLAISRCQPFGQMGGMCISNDSVTKLRKTPLL